MQLGTLTPHTVMANKAEEIQPDPGNLLESLRDFGYTLESALSDLVDNSLTANAKNIFIEVHAENDPYIAVRDDGCGMDLPRLIHAMQMGGCGPKTLREQTDLGRFGLGMKTASLSQGQSVTVITRTEGSTSLVRKWDIPYIKETKKWNLLSDVSPVASSFLEKIEKQTSGTAVIIEKLDRPTFLRVNSKERDQHLGRVLETIRGHLAMVFHRFLESGVELRLGPSPVKPWDPFLRDKSTLLPPEQLTMGKNRIEVTPYVLPHHSKITDEEHTSAGGPHGWNAHQGFYVYRCNRLIVPGTWLNLKLRKEEHFKLARIALDLPNTVDEDWHLNVMKSHVAAPAFLRDDLRRIAGAVRREASAAYRFRGEKELPQESPPERFVWKRRNVRGGVRYQVDRSHPVVRALLHSGCEHEKILEAVIRLIESTVPIANMLQEPAGTLDGSVETVSDADIEKYAEVAAHAELFLIRAGTAQKAARDKVLSSEPFVRYREEISARLTPFE